MAGSNMAQAEVASPGREQPHRPSTVVSCCAVQLLASSTGPSASSAEALLTRAHTAAMDPGPALADMPMLYLSAPQPLPWRHSELHGARLLDLCVLWGIQWVNMRLDETG
jgi:hypothetical protein